MFAPVGVRRRKQPERDQRVRDARLDQDERGHEGGRDEQQDDRLRRAPTLGTRLGQRVDEHHQARGDGEGAAGVERARNPLRAALTDEAAHEEERQHADRHVDEEDPLPARELGENTAEEHADRRARAGDAAQDPECGVALLALLERHGDDREHGGREDRPGRALERAERDQHPGRRREAAQQRGRGEDAEADEEDRPPPDQVAEAPGEQQQTAEGDQVGVDDPCEARLGEAEVILDRRQGDVDHRDVEDDHQHARAEHV